MHPQVHANEILKSGRRARNVRRTDDRRAVKLYARIARKPKGIRTPDPHTASVKATVLVRSAVSKEWRSVQLDEQFSC